MLAIIDTIIPESNFEKIRDRIASILAVEILNQSKLQHDEELNVTVFTERYTQPSSEEGLVIIVGVDRNNLEHHTNIDYRNQCTYNIDIYSFARADNSNANGYYLSSKKGQKVAGLCTKIIQNPQYIRLGYDDVSPRFVGGRRITGMQFDIPQDPQDASHPRMCRIQLDVNFNDSVQGVNGEAIEGIDTNIEIGESEKGYFIQVNNN